MIAVIDADLISKRNHNFPNLTCMKISGYYKEKGYDVVLKRDYDGLEAFEKVFISKVFTDTPFPDEVLKLPNVEYGGTGFFYDKAPNLPDEIEHHMPEYELYDEYVAERKAKGKKVSNYTDYSIGYLTRGCFRKCSFCVNQKYDRVVEHSPLIEFYNPDRKKICLLDDNFFGCPNWKNLLQCLIDTGRKFVFKQGLDERLLTDDKCKMLFSAKYDGDYIFAFDNVADYNLIEEKLKLIKKYASGKNVKFYVLCAYDRDNKYDTEFFLKDIENIYIRIKLLAKYNAIPYLMRYYRYKDFDVAGIYVALANWINWTPFYKKKNLFEVGLHYDTYGRYIEKIRDKYPDFNIDLFSWKYENERGLNND